MTASARAALDSVATMITEFVRSSTVTFDSGTTGASACLTWAADACFSITTCSSSASGLASATAVAAGCATTMSSFAMMPLATSR
ncbi:MAG: hypothetical protein BWY85_01975 [Firmicutes bacterium ADurb.Bin506]|nr:MAG: hypothetical protein BWY85_01975 [Firmicutes bacterium ADurb.Bin506]